MFKVRPAIMEVRGFRAAGVHAGLKKEGRLDFALIASDRPCTASGVFTTNRVKAAPVLLNMERLQQRPAAIRAVAVNTVSANACTGEQGMLNAREMARLVAAELGCTPEQVLVMSTGVIGTQLPMDKIAQGARLAAAEPGHGWQQAATAIMTTDTRPKQASVTVLTPNGPYTIAGISKGAGMIAPNMATMLGIVVTDAVLEVSQSHTLLCEAARLSFNRIVVDGDTSTNDMVVLLASGASGVHLHTPADQQQFQQALNALCAVLAREIVRDGEGVTRFITLDVRGAADDDTADRIAHTIAASPLVKTAFYGGDANWGRIIAAAGRAGVPFDPDIARLWFAPGETLVDDNRGLLLFEGGIPTGYAEADAAAIMAGAETYVTLECGDGLGRSIVWTCDLSHEYVSINGDYRT